MTALAQRSPRAVGRSLAGLLPGLAVAALVVLLGYPLREDPRFGPLVTRADIDWAPEIIPHHFPGGTRFVSGVLVRWGLLNVPAVAALVLLAAVGRFGRLWRATACLLLAGFVTSVASYVLWPRLYDIDRYITWPQRVVFATAAAAAVARLIERLFGTDRPRAGWVSAAVVFVCVVGTAGAGAYRLKRFWVPAQMSPAVADFLAGLPIDAHVAAYPGDGDDVPLRSRRPLLVHPVALYPYHRDFFREARGRFFATRDAVYATDWGPVRRLRTEFGAGYLLVDRARYRPDRFAALVGHVCIDHVPEYTADVRRAGPDKPYVLRDPPAEAVVMEDGGFMVIDLSRIP